MVRSEHFLGEVLADRFRELAREIQIRLSCLAPHQVDVRRVRQPTRDSRFKSVAHTIESFHGPLTAAKDLVARIHVGSEQIRRLGVRTCDEHGGDPADIRREAGSDQLLHSILRRDQDLAAHVPALFR